MKVIEGDYFIDENLDVISMKFGKKKVLKQGINSSGYYSVVFCHNGKMYGKKVHRLIAQAYIPNPENKPYINHINSIRTDNRICNLEWCTQKENIQHAWNSGFWKAAKGEKHGLAKLTEPQVIAIRSDNRSSRKIAKDYNITQTSILHIKSRRTWAHI